MHNSSKTLPKDPWFAPVDIGQETPGINAILQRSHNTQLVLHLFQLHRQLTRAEIAVRTGLTFQTVANILDRLHRRRWVRKLPPQRLTTRGAQSVPFELRGDAACSVGLQIDRDHISGLILNLAGEPLARRSVSVLSPSPTQALKTLGKFVKEFRDIPGVDGHLLGMGIAFCGLYDAIRDQIDHPHLLLAEGWRGLRVKEAFRRLSDPVSASASYGATGSAALCARSPRPRPYDRCSTSFSDTNGLPCGCGRRILGTIRSGTTMSGLRLFRHWVRLWDYLSRAAFWWDRWISRRDCPSAGDSGDGTAQDRSPL